MEKKISREEIYKGKVLDLVVDEIKTENGVSAKREVVLHRGGCAIALKDTDGKFFVVRQYRYAQEEYLLEFCAGKREPGETPLETIKREVVEELGYSAKNIVELGYVIPSCAILTEKIYLFYGEVDEKLKQHFDFDEDLKIEKYSLEEIEKMILNNEINDAKTIALTYRIKERL